MYLKCTPDGGQESVKVDERIHKTGKQSSFVDALSSNPMSVQYAPTPTEGIYELDIYCY